MTRIVPRNRSPDWAYGSQRTGNQEAMHATQPHVYRCRGKHLCCFRGQISCRCVLLSSLGLNCVQRVSERVRLGKNVQCSILIQQSNVSPYTISKSESILTPMTKT